MPSPSPLPAQIRGRVPLRRSLSLLLLAAFTALLVYLLRTRVDFHWRTLPQAFAGVAWTHIALGVAVIYLCYWLRALRWAVLLAPLKAPGTRRTTAWQLLPAQVVGFTGVALLGRVADLSRPYIIARRTGTPVATQLAVYGIERAFDLAAAATLFSFALAFAPPSMAHHELFTRAGLASVAATLLLAAIALGIRFFGERLARATQRLLHPVVPKLADLAAARVLDLRHGFGAISSMTEFVSAFSLSLLMWVGIASCYLLTAAAFRGSSPLAGFGPSATMLLLAAGIGGSVVQLPILGWFTQIALFAATLHTLFAVPVETATACATLIFFVTNLAIVPAGLATARVQGIGLRHGGTS